MYDYIKLEIKDRITIGDILSNRMLGWETKFFEETAEVSVFPKIGWFKNFKIVCLSPTYLIITGSIHKYFTGGTNHGRFNLAEVRLAIDEFCNYLKLPPSIARVINLEFGVNMYFEIDPSILLSQVLCINKKLPIRPFQNRADAFLLEFAFEKYYLKLYDKGRQCGAKNILRFEIKGSRSQYFDFCDFKVLEDLKEQRVWNALGNKLITVAQRIGFTDDTVKVSSLPANEKDIFMMMSNPLNWINPNNDSSCKKWKRRDKFKQIVKTYGERNIYDLFNNSLVHELSLIGVEGNIFPLEYN